MNAESLQKIGFSLNEAKVYLALLEFGQAMAGEISKKSQVNRTSTYDAIERLVEKGFVKYILQANRKVFQPVAPASIIEHLKEQEGLVNQLIPELNLLYKKNKEKEETGVYQGRKGIKSILNDILKYKEYAAFGSSGRFLEIMKHDFVIFQKQKKKLKIQAEVILPNSSRKSEQVKLAFTSFRYIPDEFASPTTTFIYGANVAIIVWSSVPVATLIQSMEVAESYKNYFELLWKNANK